MCEDGRWAVCGSRVPRRVSARSADVRAVPIGRWVVCDGARAARRMTGIVGAGTRSPARRRLSDGGLILATRWLKVVAEPTRVRILEFLDDRHPGGATVHEIADAQPCTRENVSIHLRLMLDVGMVSCAKEGRNRRYRLEDWSWQALVDKAADGAQTAAVDQLAVFATEAPTP